nr:hypothetical protein [Tanacetum cinerariifolium]
MDDSLVRAANTGSSLEAEQDSGNINKTQSKVTPNESSSQGTDSGGGPRFLDLENTKNTQANEIDSLKRRVKKLEKKKRSRTHKLKRLYKVSLTAKVESSDDDEDLGKDASKQGRISDIDADEGITVVSTHDDAKMFDADKDLSGEGVFVAKQDENVVEKEVDAAQVQVTTAVTTLTISIDEVTLAQALLELTHTKSNAKDKWIVIHELEESTTTTATIPKPKSPDKSKAVMVEELVKLKKKDRIQLDEEVALKLQAELQDEFDKEQRLIGERAQQEEEVNITLNKSWDNVKTKLMQIINWLKDCKQKNNKNEEGVAIDAIPLAVKPPSIFDWKIQKEGKKSYYKIIRADGSLKIYLDFSHMLKDFDREYVKTLWKLVKAKHGSTRPEEGYETVLGVI